MSEADRVGSVHPTLYSRLTRSSLWLLLVCDKANTASVNRSLRWARADWTSGSRSLSLNGNS